MTGPQPVPILEDLSDARRRLLDLIDDLDDEQLSVPRLSVVNPILWEIGHVAWFQERWCVRRGNDAGSIGRPSLRADADALYDSGLVDHDRRWDLGLPARAATLEYLQRVLDAAVERFRRSGADPEARYFVRLATFHEDMHGEALVYTRRTLGYAPPRAANPPIPAGGPCAGDADVPGGTFRLGSARAGDFTFDNEMDAHERPVAPFRISRTAVTNARFAEFVDDGGYARRELWSDAGWDWKVTAGAEHPLHWRRDGARWLVRHYDRYVEVPARAAVIHVGWHEAQAWCAWAGRRLPSELEWEVAAAGEPDGKGGLSRRKRAFPWGDEAPTPEHAHLDLRSDEPCDVEAHPAGDSAFGVRQLVGNVWEWCADDFTAYPGFVAGPYAEYSAPWFTGHKVLRGGCYATRSRLIRATYRNFYAPDRRDVLAGFRTCAVTR